MCSCYLHTHQLASGFGLLDSSRLQRAYLFLFQSPTVVIQRMCVMCVCVCAVFNMQSRLVDCFWCGGNKKGTKSLRNGQIKIKSDFKLVDNSADKSNRDRFCWL